MTRFWKSVFFEEVTVNALGTLDKPLKENPSTDKYPVPDPEDLEIYDGEGTVTGSFIDGGVQYVIVHFEQNAPSDQTPYIYIYEESDLEDLEPDFDE